MTAPNSHSEPRSHAEDVAYIAERLRETYDQEGVDIVLASLRDSRRHVEALKEQRAAMQIRIDAAMETAWTLGDCSSSLAEIKALKRVLAALGVPENRPFEEADRG